MNYTVLATAFRAPSGETVMPISVPRLPQAASVIGSHYLTKRRRPLLEDFIPTFRVGIVPNPTEVEQSHVILHRTGVVALLMVGIAFAVAEAKNQDS